MPRGSVLATTLVIGVGMASLVGAATKSRATRGWVSAVDSSAKTVTVKGKNDAVTFKLEDAGKVMEKGSPATFADLKAGEHVLIRYTGTGNDRVASEIDILAMPTAPAAQAKS